MYKYQAKALMKEFYKDTRERGTKTEELLIKENSDGSTLIFEICSFMGEYGYGWIMLDTDGNIVCDEGDGCALPICYSRFHEINEIIYWNSKFCYVVEWVDKKTPKFTFLNKETGKTYKDWFDFYEQESIDVRYVSVKEL